MGWWDEEIDWEPREPEAFDEWPGELPVADEDWIEFWTNHTSPFPPQVSSSSVRDAA